MSASTAIAARETAKSVPEYLIKEIMDWNNNVELLDGLTINVGAYLKEQKIKI